VVDSADLAVFLYDQGRLTFAETTAAMNALRSSREEKLVDGLETLAQTFGGNESLSRTITAVRLPATDQ